MKKHLVNLVLTFSLLVSVSGCQNEDPSLTLTPQTSAALNNINVPLTPPVNPFIAAYYYGYYKGTKVIVRFDSNFVTIFVSTQGPGSTMLQEESVSFNYANSPMRPMPPSPCGCDPQLYNLCMGIQGSAIATCEGSLFVFESSYAGGSLPLLKELNGTTLDLTRM
jgi:hypothetical protein